MLYLYDPRINVLTETNYASLSELTGMRKGSLMSYKSNGNKIGKLGCYLTDEKITLQQRKTWYNKEKFENETWKPVDGSDGQTFVSNYGRFKRVLKTITKFILPYIHKKHGFMLIKAKFKGVYAQYKVSKIVAYHFIGKPKNGEVVHHKNLILTDDFAGNLEYISRKKLGLKTGFKAKGKAVVQLDRYTGDLLGEYRSGREAGRKCFLSYQAVIDNCNHKSKTSGDYVFMWANEFEEMGIENEL